MVRYSRRPQGNLFDGGEIIRRYMVDCMTGKELSDATGIKISRISCILNGHCRPSKSELLKISTVLNIDIVEWKKNSSYVNEMFSYMGDV